MHLLMCWRWKANFTYKKNKNFWCNIFLKQNRNREHWNEVGPKKRLSYEKNPLSKGYQSKISTDTMPKGAITNEYPKAHLFVKHYKLFAQKHWLSKICDRDEISPPKHEKCKEKIDSSILLTMTWMHSFRPISRSYSSAPRNGTKSMKWWRTIFRLADLLDLWEACSLIDSALQRYFSRQGNTGMST